jgi:S-DNA-T family DNA segregation ATPase FtsK/SpoIIIE
MNPINTPPTFWRSPRVKRALPKEEIEIPAPPPDPRSGSGYINLLNMLLPALLMVGVMIVIGRVMGTSNWLLFSIPMMLVSSLTGLITFFLQRYYTSQKLIQREQDYNRVLSEIEKRLQNLQENQISILINNDPDPESCIKRVKNLDRSLWARTPEDDDFLSIRVGTGVLPSFTTIKLPKHYDTTTKDKLIARAQKIAKNYNHLKNVPITFSLFNYSVVGIAGPREMVINNACSLLIQLATHHSPDDVKIAAIYSEKEDSYWNWLRWLPHTWSNDRKVRFLANNHEMTHELLLSINDLLEQRLNFISEHTNYDKYTFLPYFVILLAEENLMAKEPIIEKLRIHGPKVGIFIIFLSARIKQLPQNCNFIIRMTQEHSFVRFLVTSTKDIKISPDYITTDQAIQFAQAMAPIRLQRISTKELPSTVSLFDLFEIENGRKQKVSRVEDLNVSKRWQNSHRIKSSLAAPIGLRTNGEPLVLDLHERKHGPNGLVAGMVGAGKSELLQTLVASLAINYHPHKVGFVLVDYKGGGMADPFESLPHTLGVITNLDKSNLAIRALTSFRVELEKRMRLFKEASSITGINVNHIDTYQRLYYQGKVKQPLSYLVVIVDEFAEMKTEQPEIAKEFVKIARLGRAPGLCLILAMQKPAGIVDGQIEGNTRFRLCLRVASTEDSQAMLKRPDAAYLTGIGRAYLQVGANEIFELFQVAWSGAPYDPDKRYSADPLMIVQVMLNGSRHILLEPSRSQDIPQNDITQLKALISHLEEVARNEGIAKLQGLWLPPLPEHLILEDIRPKEGWNGNTWTKSSEWLSPVIGLVDDPRQQRQYPLYIPFAKEGHLLIYGAPSSGKTTLIQTLTISLALTYSPEDINIYIIDFGGRLLKQLEMLPHIGSVVTIDESERLERLFKFLFNIMDDRRDYLSKIGIGTFSALRTIEQKLPAIILIIDNYANFRETYEEYEDKVVQIVRDGANLGIYVVITVNDTSSVRLRLTSNINMAIALQMVEVADYAAIVGRTDGLVPAAIPGRGLIRGNPPLEFQTALPQRGANDAERAKNLRDLIRTIADSWNGQKAPSIRIMPTNVTFSDIAISNQEIQNMAQLANSLIVPLGLQFSDLNPLLVDMNINSSFLVTGPARSGKTTLLRTWITALTKYYDSKTVKIFVIDSHKSDLKSISSLSHIEDYINTNENIDALSQKIAKIFEERKNDYKHKPFYVIFVDDILDSYNDITNDNIKSILLSIIRYGQKSGIYTIIAANSNDVDSKGWNEPIKTVKTSQVGFMLGIGSDSIFNLRLPYSERDKILSPGDAYWVYRGQSIKVRLINTDQDK